MPNGLQQLVQYLHYISVQGLSKLITFIFNVFNHWDSRESFTLQDSKLPTSYKGLKAALIHFGFKLPPVFLPCIVGSTVSS